MRLTKTERKIVLNWVRFGKRNDLEYVAFPDEYHMPWFKNKDAKVIKKTYASILKKLRPLK